MDHEPVKITIFLVLFIKLKWRDCHYTPALVVDVTDSMNEALVAWEQLPGALPPAEFPTSLTTEICGNFDEFSITIGTISTRSLSALTTVR